MLTPNSLHIVVLSDTDGGLQVWSGVEHRALFSSYRVESLHKNEIHLKVHIDNLQRALRSAHNLQSATLKLTKKQNLPISSLSVQSMTSSGHTLHVCQDITVRVLKIDQVRAMREPEVPDAH
ncbi:Checkpoint protein hus1, partial [Coemansia sp. RSA 1972]